MSAWGLQDNPARHVDLPALKNGPTEMGTHDQQAAQLFDALPPLARTMAGLAMLSGLRRGELFALRWRDFDEQDRCVTVREAVYEGWFDTPQTEAAVRQIPLSDAALKLVADWRARAKRTDADMLMFSPWDNSVRRSPR